MTKPSRPTAGEERSGLNRRTLFAGASTVGALAAAAGQGADPFVHAAAARFLALGLVGWGLVAAWAAWVWRRSPCGQLVWRAGQWQK